MKLTLPADGPGYREILVDGTLRGDVLRACTKEWCAELHLVKDASDFSDMETTGAETLRDLRAKLQSRLDQQGPWWTDD